MIADLKTFIEREKPHWDELERELSRVREGLADMADLAYSRKLLSMFQRASSDLARIQGYSAEPELITYLETLVGNGYAEIHSSTHSSRRFAPLHWFLVTFPQTFRRQVWGFWLATWLTLAGMILGAVLVAVDPVEGREVSFGAFAGHVVVTPSQRVAEEEKEGGKSERLAGHHATFSAQLMQNNIGVSFKAFAFGMTYGLGTILLLFYNGVILGGISLDYIMDGQTVFLLAWLLPHGSFEIPAILIGGQAGLLLGRALIGWGTSHNLRTRFRLIVPDMATLVGGTAVMLVWAGLNESFFSQYHAPLLPYWIKITYGALELVGLFWFLFRCGRSQEERAS
jgi:uncharacterized membrane protein SpoIIM required for sporulation